MTALTAYLSSTTATTVTTAKTLLATAPASSTSVTNKTGKSASGWGVLHTIAYSTAFAAAASEPAFGDVNGAILDDTSLEGQTIAAGSWSCSMHFSSSSGTLTGVIYVRVGKRSSAGVYTEIVNMAAASTGFTSAGQTVTASGTGAATAFAVGDKLYMQIDLQITANTSSSATATTSVFENGGALESVVTPGYAATLSQTGVYRMSLAAGHTPATRTSHSLNVRARTTSGAGTIRMALYEGATNRSGDLESSALTTSLANYTLPISDANAASITDYSNLEIRLWGYAAAGGAIVFEVDQVWLEAPDSAAGIPDVAMGLTVT
jgi:hypothetical protein